MPAHDTGFRFLDTMAARSRSFCFLRDPPDGTDALTHRMATGIAMGSDYPAMARVRMAADKPGIQLPSIIGNTNAFLIVDARTRRLFEEARLGPTEFLPLAIFNHKDRLASPDYCIVNPLGTVDCLDLEASEIEWLDGEIVEVTTHVLDRRRLEGAPDLFRIRETPRLYVVSDRLAARLEAAGTTNLAAPPIRVTG